jgi:O-antigen ligase
MFITKNDIQILSAKKANIHDRIALLLCVVIATTLPFFIQINSLFVLLLSLNWVIDGKWKNKWQLFKASPYAILWVGFFALNALSQLYSSNVKEANFELEKKLSFIAFPLIFFTSAFITSDRIKLILKFFVLACLLACAICISNAIIHLVQGDRSYLFYHQLASPLGFHAVYFSMYVGFCLFMVLFDAFGNWASIRKSQKLLYVCVLVFFFLFIVLLSSKTMLVSTVAIIALKFTFGHVQNKLRAFSIMAIAAIALSIIITKAPYISDRFNEIFQENYAEVLTRTDYQNFHFTGGTIRLAIWRSVFEVLDQQNAWLLGVGIGDAQDLLTANYNTKHIYPGDAVLGFKGFTHYNAHNQYLQFLLSTGIIGLVLFVTILVYAFVKSWQTKNSLLLSILFLFCSFCFTESVLSSHKGVVFFLFFSSLLLQQTQTKKTN